MFEAPYAQNQISIEKKALVKKVVKKAHRLLSQTVSIQTLPQYIHAQCTNADTLYVCTYIHTHYTYILY